MNDYKLCVVRTIDGLAALAELHEQDTKFVPLISVRHPATFDVAVTHKRRQTNQRYDRGWNEQAALLTALIGYGPEVFEHVAAMVGAFPAYGPRPDYRKPEAYREVAAFMSRIRDALNSWGYKSAKVGVDFERNGQWREDPNEQPYADGGQAVVALAGAFDDGERADFIMPVWKGDPVRSMENIAASSRSTVLIGPEYYPARDGRRPPNTIPQHWGSPVEPDFYDPEKPWSRLYTCQAMIDFPTESVVYFRRKQEADGYLKMADLVGHTSKPKHLPDEPDPVGPTDPDELSKPVDVRADATPTNIPPPPIDNPPTRPDADGGVEDTRLAGDVGAKPASVVGRQPATE